MSLVLQLPFQPVGFISHVLTIGALPTDVEYGSMRFVESNQTAYIYTSTLGWVAMGSGGGGGAVDSVNGQTGVVVLDTDDIPEGVTNLYYTEARVEAHNFTNLQATNATIDNLTVTTMTHLDSAIVTVGDNIIILNSLASGAPTMNAGIEINRGTSTDSQVLWNETTDRWQFGIAGSLKNVLLLTDFSALGPIFYDNTIGQFSLGVVPVTSGGTGQSNQQAAINELTNPSATATNNQVFTWSSGNAQFIDLPASAVHSNPNVFAFFNSTGVLDQLAAWQVDPTTFSTAVSLTLTAPADTGSNVYPQGLALYINVDMAADSTEYHPSAARIELNIDPNATGYDLEDAQGLLINSRHQGAGNIQRWDLVNFSHSIGTGSNAGRTTSARTFNSGTNIGANYQVDDFQYSANNINSNGTVLGSAYIYNTGVYGGGGTYEYLNGYNLDINVPVQFDLSGYNLTANGTVARNVTGYSVNLGVTQTDPTGYVNLFNANSYSDVAGYRNMFNSNNSGNTGQDFRNASFSNSGTVAGNAAGILMFQNGAVARNWTGYHATYAAATLGQSGDNHYLVDVSYNNNTGIYLGNLNGLNMNYNGVSTDGDISPVTISNNISGVSYRGIVQGNQGNFSDEVRLLSLNTQGNARTLTGASMSLGAGTITDDARGWQLYMDPGFSATSFQGMDLTVQGTFGSVQGLVVRVNNAILTTPGAIATSIQTEGGTLNLQSDFAPASGGTFGLGDFYSVNIRVPSGSPLTGTEVFGHLILSQMSVEDDVAAGPIGLGFSAGGFVNNVGIAAGKTISAPMSGFIVAATSQPVPYADGGTIQDYRAVDILGVLNFGGSVIVDKFTGINMRAGFDSGPTAAWGIVVDGATADNYLNKLGLGTVGFVNTSGYLLDVNGKSIFADDLDTSGNFRATVAGKGVQIKEGADARSGVATLIAGAVTVSNTSVTTVSRIHLTRQLAVGGLGHLSIANRLPGVSFDIVSTDITELSDIAYLMIEGI